MVTAGLTGTDASTTNYAYAIDYANDDLGFRRYLADDLFSGLTFANTFYVNNAGDLDIAETSFTSRLLEPDSAISEPSVLALLGIGLVGVGFSNRKAQQ